VGQRQVVIAQYAQAQVDLSADGVEVHVVGFLGDAEAAQAHRQHPFGSPDEQGEGSFRGNDLDRAGRQQRHVGDDQGTLGVDQHLQGRELRIDAQGGRQGIRLFQPVGRIELDIQLDVLDRRALQAQGLGAITPLSARRLRLQGAGQGIGVVLKHDHARQRVERIDADDGAFHQAGGTRKSSHVLHPRCKRCHWCLAL